MGGEGEAEHHTIQKRDQIGHVQGLDQGEMANIRREQHLLLIRTLKQRVSTLRVEVIRAGGGRGHTRLCCGVFGDNAVGARRHGRVSF